MEIKVTTKSVYGEVKVYPACKISEGFAKIAGTKTLTHANLITIEAMGFEIVDATPSKLPIVLKMSGFAYP